METSRKQPADNTAPLIPAEPSDSKPCKLDVVANLPIHLQQDHILVDATINEQAVSLILDTGDQDTILTPDAAKRLRLNETNLPAGAVAGIGGVQKSSYYQANNVRFGSIHSSIWNFEIADVGVGKFRPAPDGLLGSDLLRTYDVDLNLAGGRLTLFFPEHDCSQPSAYLTKPLHMADLEGITPPGIPISLSSIARPIVHVRVGAQSLVAMIDTGSPITTLFTSAVSKLKWTQNDLAGDAAAVAAGIGPNAIPALNHELPAMGIGNLLLTKVPVTLVTTSMGPAGPDMLIGLDVLRRVHVWISHSSDTLIMQYPPLPSPPLPPDVTPSKS